MRRLTQQAYFQAFWADELGEGEEWRILECRVAQMNVRIDETRADYSLKIGVHLASARFLYDSVPDADVALNGLEIIAIDYGSLQNEFILFGSGCIRQSYFGLGDL